MQPWLVQHLLCTPDCLPVPAFHEIKCAPPHLAISFFKWPTRQVLNKIELPNNSSNNKFPLVYFIPQIKAKTMSSIMIIFCSLYVIMKHLLQQTCLSSTLNGTWHLTGFVFPCWPKVMLHFHNLFINNHRVSQETTPHTCVFKKLMAFSSTAQATHLEGKSYLIVSATLN